MAEVEIKITHLIVEEDGGVFNISKVVGECVPEGPKIDSEDSCFLEIYICYHTMIPSRNAWVKAVFVATMLGRV